MLEQIVRSRQTLLRNRSIVCSVDWGSVVPDILADSKCLDAIELVLDSAIENSPVAGEILITVVRTDLDAMEIEIADSGERYALAAEVSFRLACASRLLDDQGGRLEIKRCPQGGTAYTICFVRSRDRVAA
jgi:hypothetical protein